MRGDPDDGMKRKRLNVMFRQCVDGGYIVMLYIWASIPSPIPPVIQNSLPKDTVHIRLFIILDFCIEKLPRLTLRHESYSISLINRSMFYHFPTVRFLHSQYMFHHSLYFFFSICPFPTLWRVEEKLTEISLISLPIWYIDTTIWLCTTGGSYYEQLNT